MEWVSSQLAPQAEIIKGEVTKIDLSGDGKSWELSIDGYSEGVFCSDRLMLTGPGKARLDQVGGVLPRGAYDLETFWEAMKKKRFGTTGKTAIIGAGENAASALLALSKYAPDLQVEVISPKGFISTRSENFYENQVYSQPERNGWSRLDVSDRIDFIERTDLGVFSAHAMSILNDVRRHQIVPGRMVGLVENAAGLSVQLQYGKDVTTHVYSQVILATGFDQVAILRSILGARARAALASVVGPALDQRKIAERIDEDLSVKGVTPTLHMPMLAGLMQGPGFGNLSCLGKLSDRVVLSGMLDAYSEQTEFRQQGAVL
jgi:mycobactin lysine-N-oxygenase